MARPKQAMNKKVFIKSGKEFFEKKKLYSAKSAITFLQSSHMILLAPGLRSK